MSRSNTIKILKALFVITVVISLVLFARTTDLDQVSHSLRQIGYKFVFLLLITFTAYWLATVGWKYCMEKKTRLPGTGDLFLIRHIGEMVSLINSASVVGGEAVKVYLLEKKGVDRTTILTSVLISRLMMAVTQLVLFVFVIIILLINNDDFFSWIPAFEIPYLAILVLLGVVAGLIFVGRLVKKNGKNSRFNRLMHALNSKLKLDQVIGEFGRFMRTNKKGLAWCTFFFLLHWIVGSLEIYFILKFLGIKSALAPIIFVDMGIVIIKSAGAFVPGQIGVEEFGNKIMLGLIGIPDDSVWITVSVLRRSRQLFWILFGLGIYLLFYKRLNRLPNLS